MPVLDKPKDETKGQILNHVIDRVVESYGFGTSWSVNPIIPMNGALVVLNARSETTKKAVIEYKGEHFIIKEVPWYCSDMNFVNFMLSFQDYLTSEKFPCPEVIKTENGSLYSSVLDRFYYMQRFVHGTVFKSLDSQLYSAGMSLGKLHGISSRRGARIADSVSFGEDSFSIAYNMLNILENLVKNNTGRLKKDENESLKGYLASSRVWLSTLDEDRHLHDTKIQVHGDYNPLNVLYNEESEIIATFDMENTAIDRPAHDLAEGIMDFCYNNYKPYSSRFAMLPDTRRADKAEIFLEGYKSTCDTELLTDRLTLSRIIGATYVELVTLGLVRGDFDFSVSDEAVQRGMEIVNSIVGM